MLISTQVWYLGVHQKISINALLQTSQCMHGNCLSFIENTLVMNYTGHNYTAHNYTLIYTHNLTVHIQYVNAYSLQCPCGSLTFQTLQLASSQPPHGCQWQQGGGHSHHPAAGITQCKTTTHNTQSDNAMCTLTAQIAQLTTTTAFLSHPNLVISSLTMSANPHLAAARTPVQPLLGKISKLINEYVYNTIQY